VLLQRGAARVVALTPCAAGAGATGGPWGPGSDRRLRRGSTRSAAP
jgi:hypothetical protein